ncbi:MAG: thrombospondin type 3 repeat-containing protein [Tepidisphaeraceae bacterium]
MAKRKQNQTIAIIVIVAVVASVFTTALFLGGQNLIQGNFVPLALVEDATFFRCDAWNELAVTKAGVTSVVGSGRQGFNPSFDSSFATFDVTDAGIDVSSFHVRLLLECKGYNITYSTSTTVQGSISFQLCAEVSGTVCFVGDDRTFTNLMGSLQATQTFANVPIEQQTIVSGVPKVVYEGDISAQEIERLFGGTTGSLFMKSTMYPVLTFTFNHPTKGIFVSNYNALTANQPIYAEYGGLQITAVDTDNDGISDTNDGCINQPETVNGYQDTDGCPDVLPPPDADADGIADASDQCIIEPETANGFQDEDGCPDDVPPPTAEVITDTDRDGVADQSDSCPTTVGTIANNGCPETQIEEPTSIQPTQPAEVPPPLFQQPATQQPTTTTTQERPSEGESERNLIIIIMIIIALAVVSIVARLGKIKL